MADLKVEGLPEKQSVKEGASVSFKVTVSGGTEPYKFTWKKGDEKIPGSPDDRPVYPIDNVKSADAGVYSVDVEDGQGNKGSSAKSSLEVEEIESVPLWRPKVAIYASVVAAAVLVVLTVPMWFTAIRVFPSDDEPTLFSGVIAVEAVIIGTLALVFGFYLAFLEFSSRARTIKEMRALAEPGTPIETESWGEVAKAAPELVTRFGQLKAPAAAMIVGVALFVCATAIAWKALPDTGGQSEQTTTTDTETTPTPTPTPSETPAPGG